MRGMNRGRANPVGCASKRAGEWVSICAAWRRPGSLSELEQLPEWLARGYAGEMNYLRDARRAIRGWRSKGRGA